MGEDSTGAMSGRLRAIKASGAILLTFAFALCIYWYLDNRAVQVGLISLTFLLILPAALSAAIAVVLDWQGRRELRFYFLVPMCLFGVAAVAATILLREGAVCIIMLAPLWLLAGLGGSLGVYSFRKRRRSGGALCTVVLVIPLLAIQAEGQLPTPEATARVSRDIVVAASPERIWPLLIAIPQVRAGEGRWNVSQDVIGIPRPLDARLVGQGIGAERLARWDAGIKFREVITEWRPLDRIAWDFVFDDMTGWGFTDRHLIPDSSYFKVLKGGYVLTPLGPGRTRVSLDTTYWMKTPVNGYAALWGEFFLGDLQTNLLALVKRRAERSPVAGS